MRTTSRLRPGLALAALVLAAPAAPAEPLTAAMRREDPRLAARVSLAANTLYTSEVVEQLGAAGGVSLRTRKGDGSGNVRVALVLRDVPLADAMDAVWSLVSYTGARWHWEREGTAPEFRYVLTRPRAAQLFPARARLHAQAALERHAERMLGALDLSPEERRELAKQDRAATLIDTSRYNRGGLTAFRELFTPEQRRDLLRGPTGVVRIVPLSKASPAVQRFARSEYDFAWQPLPYPLVRTEPPPPPPDRIGFSTTQLPGMFTPMLVVSFPNMGGYSYLGGRFFQDQLREEFYDLWLQPGDLRRTVLGDRVSAPPLSRPPGEAAPEPWQPVAAERLRALSEGAKLSFIARLDFGNTIDHGAPSGKRVQEYLDHLADTLPNYQAKWRREVLLLTDPAWFQGHGAVEVPFEVVAGLRKAEQEHGFLPLGALSAAVRQLSDQQLLSLGDEFPVLRRAAYWRGIFALHAASPLTAAALTSSRGVPVAQVRAALADIGDARLLRSLSDERGAVLRIREEGERKERRLRFELLDRSGRPVWGGELPLGRGRPADTKAALPGQPAARR